MKLPISRFVAALCLAALASLAAPQWSDSVPWNVPAKQDSDPKLPNGKSQRDAILKQEHEQNVKDAAQLAQLTKDLQEDIDKNDVNVLPLATLKKIDEIDKLVKKIRSRLRHD